MHPFLEDALIRNQVFDETSLKQFLDFIDLQPNMRVDKSDNYFDLFVSSNAMITDGVSFLAEYALTKKPLLNTINNDGPSLNLLGESLRSNLYTAINNEEIKNFIHDVILNENDHMFETRSKNIDELIGVNHTGMVERIINFIKEDINSSSNAITIGV